eukprot:Seg836.6 transcript_id=Seg836.6/GoldUCD/mRNA.D3Y31 product="All-trans retinoic acid-induced differentiation factor" protein_id=Seg836.6/GoldUCD/D3Y31
METKVWRHSFLNFLALAWLSQFVFTKDLHCNKEDNQHLKKFCEICMVQGKDKTAERRSCVTDGNGLSNSESRDHGSQAFQYGRCCAQPDCTVDFDATNCSLPSDEVYEAQKVINLRYLKIEKDKKCPGQDSTWSVRYINDVKICTNKLHTCNVTCPDNSHCVAVNGTAECLCNEGWHGYKCLRYGKFPAVKWLVSIGAGTFGLIVILWSFQKYSAINIRKKSEQHGTGKRRSSTS